MNYPPGTVQYAYALDCQAQGCDPPHDDDREVRQLDGRWEYPQPGYRINRHAVKPVTRTMPEWRDMTEDEVLAAMQAGKERVTRLLDEAD